MAYVGRDFTVTDVGENEVYSFNFAKDLVAGETIQSATWQCSDTTVMLLIGSLAISGAIVSQRLSAQQSGSTTLGCFVVTSLGNIRHLYASAVVQAV